MVNWYLEFFIKINLVLDLLINDTIQIMYSSNMLMEVGWF